MSNDTIAVAMSGGVDSSTVAAMLHAEGHNVIGLTMQLWNQRRSPGTRACPNPSKGAAVSIDDVYDARRVAETIGIPYYVVNMKSASSVTSSAPSSRSTSPDVRPSLAASCNNHLKFDQLLVVARQIGAGPRSHWTLRPGAFRRAAGRWLLKRPATGVKTRPTSSSA